MGKIIAVANQKGGVGKTTTCVNLTCALKKRGRRVLLVDCDPQGNSTSGMGVDKTATPNCYDMLMNGAAAADCIRSTKYGDVLPANMNLSGCSVELVSSEQREYIMKTALAAVQDDYDFILIDCPPSLELLTINALVAADSVLIPVQCEYYALEGIADLMRSIKMCNKRLNPELTVQGIVMTMYDGRTKLSDQVVNEVRKFFGKKVYKTMIPRNVRLSEAPSHRKPAIAYDKESKGARAYLHLAGELIKREEKAAKAAGEKSVEMVPVSELLGLTGYVRGRGGRSGGGTWVKTERRVSAWASARSSGRNIRPRSRNARRQRPTCCRSRRSSRAPTSRASTLTRRRWKCSQNPSGRMGSSSRSRSGRSMADFIRSSRASAAGAPAAWPGSRKCRCAS